MNNKRMILKEDVKGLKFLIKEYKKNKNFKKMAECEKELKKIQNELKKTKD